jgi:hypothetical protein
MVNRANAANATTDVKAYRHQHRGHAATILSVVVSVATVVGGYEVIRALNVDGPSHASSIFPATREVLRKSIAEVLDERLSEDRLKAMLGVSVSAAAAKEREQQNALASIARQEGRPVQAPPPGPDYAVRFFKARSVDLADELASHIDISAVNTLSACPQAPAKGAIHEGAEMVCIAERKRDAELLAIRKVVGRSVDSSVLEERASAWARLVAGDAGVEQVWVDGKYKTSAAAFVVRAIDPPTMPDAIAKRVANAISVHTVDAAAVAPAARGVASRLTWGVTAILFIGLWSAAMLVAGWQLWSLLPTPRSSVVALAAGLVAAFVSGYLTYEITTRGPETFSLLGPLLQRLETESGTRILSLARLFGAMTTSAVVLLLTAASLTTWFATKGTVESHLEGLRTVFNVAAALLVAESIQIAALYRWPAAMLEYAQATTGPLENAALLTAGLAGAIFSVALMVVYLPSVSVLRAVAREGRDPAAEKLLQDHGVSDSGLQWFMRLLQALAPLLVAVPVSGLLEMFQ